MSTESRYWEKDCSARAYGRNSAIGPGAFGGTPNNYVLGARKGRGSGIFRPQAPNLGGRISLRLPSAKIAAPSEMGFKPSFSERSLRPKARFRLSPPFFVWPPPVPRSTHIRMRFHKALSHAQ
jgi:hypothetical protein